MGQLTFQQFFAEPFNARLLPILRTSLSLGITPGPMEEELMRKTIQKPMPPMARPAPEITDRGTVRLGDSNVTAEFPPVGRPTPEIADRGTTRLGDSNVTAEFTGHDR